VRARIFHFAVAAVLATGVVGVAPRADAAVSAGLKVVQHTSATTGNATAGSLGATFPTATRRHSVLVVAVTTDGSVFDGAQSVTDSAGNAWTLAVQTGFGESGFMETEYWYAKNAQPATSLTITWATFTGHVMLDAYEIGGADRVTPLAGYSTGTQAISATECQTPIDPGVPNYLVIGMVSGSMKQAITIVEAGYHAAKRLSAANIVMRTAVMAPANGLTTFTGSWAEPMPCSAISIAFRSPPPSG